MARLRIQATIECAICFMRKIVDTKGDFINILIRSRLGKGHLLRGAVGKGCRNVGELELSGPIPDPGVVAVLSNCSLDLERQRYG